MGNQATSLGDGDYAETAARDIAHFDHSFKTELHSTHGPHFQTFGELKQAKRPVQLTCKTNSLEIVEDSLKERKVVEMGYDQVNEVGWDHATCEVKFTLKKPDQEDSFCILVIDNSVEFEHELKLRFAGMSQRNAGKKPPMFNYVGVFAGATKPKPFQRKRPNLSKLPLGKLPPLATMRATAIELHKGSYAPCPPGQSRRIELALQHIYDGYNTFPVTYVRGQMSLANQWRLESLLLITESKMVFRPTGINGTAIDIPFDTITDWKVVDNEHIRTNDSGIDVFRDNGDHHYFGVPYIRDVKNTLEYFWNRYQLSHGRPVKLGSAHGRPLETINTLSGEVRAPPSPVGNLDIVDVDGTVVRPGAMRPQNNAPARRGSLGAAITVSNQPKPYPHENPVVKNHWRHIVKHQGWLLKKGGVGVGNAKQWIKRFFVLYNTSQGHFLIYYSDVTECPLYTTERHERNVVDCAKTTFIRPGSNKAEFADTPPHSFDIVTIEREWTLCAETADNARRWLQLLNRAVDEDVAIIPDENLIFKVKPKVDALGVFSPVDYSTTIRVSANAVTVSAPDPPGSFTEKEQCFWVYTDFYKWSLLSQNGKLALLVNVFSDSSFTKRIEFVFRSKESVRLATAIEFFIEKFMTCMHLRLETEGEAAGEETAGNPGGMASHQEWAEEPQSSAYGQEIDLLDMGMGELEVSSPPPPVPNAPPSFSNDFDFFGDSSPPPPPAGGLTTAQVAQHAAWLKSALLSSGGPLYDDGALQVATRVEIRGSQGRLTLFYRNNGADISDLSVELVDPAGLLRVDVGALAPALSAGGQASQQIMIECMKPATPAPSLAIRYTGKTGRRDNTLPLPLAVTSFNEPLNLTGPDFMSKWDRLVAPGQEKTEKFTPKTQLDANAIRSAVSSALKFSPVSVQGESLDVVYGAASLRTGAVGPNGDKVTVGCLIKIALDARSNVVTVTCRTVHAAATSAVMETAIALLS